MVGFQARTNQALTEEATNTLSGYHEKKPFKVPASRSIVVLCVWSSGWEVRMLVISLVGNIPDVRQAPTHS